MILAGRITRRIKPTAIITGTKNRFMQVANNFIYPTIFLLEDYQRVSKHSSLLAKGLFSLSLMLDAAQNHWQVD